MAETVRKPRLTDGILDDLGIAVATLQDEIDYLDDARRTSASTPALQERFGTKHTALVRARDWLSRHIEATRSQRGGQDLFEMDTGATPAPEPHQIPQVARP